MKSATIIPLFVFLVLILGCRQSTEPGSGKFYVNIEAESSFMNDSVKASLDDRILLDATITTNDVLSLAWGSGLQELSGNNHVLKFDLVSFGIHKDYIIKDQYDTTSVFVRFNRNTKEITFTQIKGIMFRD